MTRGCKVVFRMKDGGRFERIIYTDGFRNAVVWAFDQMKKNNDILEIVSVRIKGRHRDRVNDED